MSVNAKELIRAGKLSEARQQLTDEVKSTPADMTKRTLLFQVLAFCGEWDKAERHLEIISSQDSKSEIGAQVYKNLIQAEKDRAEIFKRNRRPSFLTKTPSYLETYFTAWDKLDQKKINEAKDLFDQIETSLPPISGTINDKSFIGFKDMDSILPFFLEVIVYEQYAWIPLTALQELTIVPPTTLFDLLWIQGHIFTREGLSINCYLPVLYPDSFLHQDDRVKLGRMTDWISLGGSFYRGKGQHIFQAGEEELGILEIRNVIFESLAKETKDEKSD